MVIAQYALPSGYRVSELDTGGFIACPPPIDGRRPLPRVVDTSGDLIGLRGFPSLVEAVAWCERDRQGPQQRIWVRSAGQDVQIARVTLAEMALMVNEERG